MASWFASGSPDGHGRVSTWDLCCGADPTRRASHFACVQACAHARLGLQFPSDAIGDWCGGFNGGADAGVVASWKADSGTGATVGGAGAGAVAGVEVSTGGDWMCGSIYRWRLDVRRFGTG